MLGLVGGSWTAESAVNPSKLPARLAVSTGQQFYVDGEKGSDSNRGTLRAPWRTIGRAWRSVPAGAVITVRKGTYRDGVALTGRSAPPSKPITLRAFPGETVTLRNDETRRAAVYIEDVGGLRVRGFNVTNPTGDGIKVTNSANVELFGNAVYETGGQAILVVGSGSAGRTTSSNIQLWANRIHANGGPSSSLNHGIYYGASSDASDGGTRRGTIGGVIANNIVFDQRTGYLLQIGPQAEGVVITNNTLTGARSSDPHTGSAIRVWGNGGPFATKNVVVVNNAIAFNSNKALQVTDDVLPAVEIHHNLGFGNAGGDFPSGQLNLTSLDPAFTSSPEANFRPRPGSPLIGRADPAYAPSTDASGAARRGAPDIGALEYTGAKLASRG